MILCHCEGKACGNLDIHCHCEGEACGNLNRS